MEENGCPAEVRKNRMDLLKDEPGSSNETCVTSVLHGNEVIGIEAEMVSSMTEEEDPDSPTIPVIKTEPTNCMDFVEGEAGSCSETCVMFEEVSIKVEAAVGIKDEIPEPTLFIPINTEHEGTLNEELHVHSAECRSSCDIRNFDHPNRCAICNKEFNTKSTLIKHERIHSGDRPYRCAVCNKAFSQKGHMLTHQRIHSGDRPYSCAVCNKAFSRKSSLVTHQRVHSGEGSYICAVCSKAFSDQRHLITHGRVHSGDSFYSCAVCNKAVSTKGNLMRHRRIHSGERPYSCAVCNKTFSDQSNLIRHQRIHCGECPNT